MINIDLNGLNALEVTIYNTLMAASKEHPDIKINQAAEICGCSISKISKFVKKLGFSSYKQYSNFLYGKEVELNNTSSELSRLRLFIDDFDQKLVDEFIELFNDYDRILLFGYGPSFIVAQYFEYRLRITSNKFILSIHDEVSINNMVDDKTLLIIFTATGTFRSFENIYKNAKEKGSEVLIIAEEYNTSLFSNCDKILWLSKFPQPATLKPHEKTRTIFFIFIEEVIRAFIKQNYPEE
jgi:DNA-binding MurR/RpiR family transcriptional regulator